MRHIKSILPQDTAGRMLFSIKTACQKPTPGLQRPHQAALPFNVSSVQTPDVPDVYSYISWRCLPGRPGAYRNFSTGFFQAANGCETIYLDYRCAPDYQYPTQLNEALDLWDDLTKRQGYAPDQIILGGDSAGANLALALLLKLRDLNKTMPRAAFCISAWTDITCNTQSFRDNYGRDVMFGNK